MVKTREQKVLDEELLMECRGYHELYDKPDGAYIQVGEWFFNLNKIKRLIASGADVNAKGYLDRTPLIITHSQEIKSLLKQHGAK